MAKIFHRFPISFLIKSGINTSSRYTEFYLTLSGLFYLNKLQDSLSSLEDKISLSPRGKQILPASLCFPRRFSGFLNTSPVPSPSPHSSSTKYLLTTKVSTKLRGTKCVCPIDCSATHSTPIHLSYLLDSTGR